MFGELIKHYWAKNFYWLIYLGIGMNIVDTCNYHMLKQCVAMNDH